MPTTSAETQAPQPRPPGRPLLELGQGQEPGVAGDGAGGRSGLVAVMDAGGAPLAYQLTPLV